MKKILLFMFPILFLIYWGCEDEAEVEVDTTPPTVSITSHESGQSDNANLIDNCFFYAS